MMLIVELHEVLENLTLENKTNDIYFHGGTSTNGQSIGRANNPSLGYFAVTWQFDYGLSGTYQSTYGILIDNSESIGWSFSSFDSSNNFLLLFNTADGSLNKCYKSDIGYNTNYPYLNSFNFDPTSTYIYSFFVSTAKICKIMISNGVYTCLTSSGFKTFQNFIYIDTDKFLLYQFDSSGKEHQYIKLKYQASASFPLLKISCTTGDGWTSSNGNTKSIYDGSSKIYTSLPRSSDSYSVFAIIDAGSFTFTQIYYSTLYWYNQMGMVMSASKIFNIFGGWNGDEYDQYIFTFDISSSTYTQLKFTTADYYGLRIDKNYNLLIGKDSDLVSKLNIYSFPSDYKILILNLINVKIYFYLSLLKLLFNVD